VFNVSRFHVNRHLVFDKNEDSRQQKVLGGRDAASHTPLPSPTIVVFLPPLDTSLSFNHSPYSTLDALYSVFLRLLKYFYLIVSGDAMLSIPNTQNAYASLPDLFIMISKRHLKAVVNNQRTNVPAQINAPFFFSGTHICKPNATCIHTE